MPVIASVAAATDPAASLPVVKIGSRTAVMLAPATTVTPVTAPRKTVIGDSFAGFARVDVATAGTYRIALGDAAWIEVVQDGTAIASTGHGHGPACTGIRKIVDFTLSPGSYTLQITGSMARSPQLLIVAAP